jgi:S1-C subfamily serine protease
VSPLIVFACALSACSVTGSTSSSSSSTGSPVAQKSSATMSVPDVVTQVSPSVVLIQTASGLGSGVVYDGSGDIVTNAHVVGDSTSFVVTASDGKQYSATLVGSYVGGDIAVIKVSTTSLHPARWGSSNDLRVGDAVLAMGNPLGFQSSVTDGIVSGLGRTVSEPDGAVLPDVIQTSAAINPGNSGGALVDLQAEVIGIPTLAAVDPQVGAQAPGIGFALPSDGVKNYADQIIQNGKVVDTNRAYLGIQAGDTGGQGVVVLAVQAAGPAFAAGVQSGDIILSINGNATPTTDALSQQLANLKPGDVASLGLKRNGVPMSIKVTLGTMPSS